MANKVPPLPILPLVRILSQWVVRILDAAVLKMQDGLLEKEIRQPSGIFLSGGKKKSRTLVMIWEKCRLA